MWTAKAQISQPAHSCSLIKAFTVDKAQENLLYIAQHMRSGPDQSNAYFYSLIRLSLHLKCKHKALTILQGYFWDGPDPFCVKAINVRLKLNLFLAGPLYKLFKSSVYFVLRGVLRILGPVKISRGPVKI